MASYLMYNYAGADDFILYFFGVSYSCCFFITEVTVIVNDERDTFYLTMLASIEVAHHKGNDVLVQAMNKVWHEINYQNRTSKQNCTK